MARSTSSRGGGSGATGRGASGRGSSQGGAGGGLSGGGASGGRAAAVGANPGSSPGAGTGPGPAGGSPSLGRKISDIFGGPTAYANNPSAPHNTKHAALVANFPHATPGYVLGSVLGAPMSPWGAVAALPNIGHAIATNTPPESMMQRAAVALGASRGPQEGMTGVGRDNEGRGSDVSRGLLSLQNTNQISPEQVGGQPQMPNQGRGWLSQLYPGANVPIGGPTPYGYTRPGYSFFN